MVSEFTREELRQMKDGFEHLMVVNACLYRIAEDDDRKNYCLEQGRAYQALSKKIEAILKANQ